ncbi:hypothetical protein I8755_03150 [Streptomyces alfalfae]|uniref:Uncharacterized protein n=1 Tax=Streptomyces alfalfae TaxID=1642299 RepID=A0A7T4TWS9_9ACTN|nr:hypothetical protein I8755_03150 [Streptomyces alfalfae]
MTHPVDADELLIRIRGARDWASSEADRIFAHSETLQSDGRAAEALNASIEARAFHSIRIVLDEILRPGTHGEPRPGPR